MNAGVRRQLSGVRFQASGRQTTTASSRLWPFPWGGTPDADFCSLFSRQNLNLRVFLGVRGSL